MKWKKLSHIFVPDGKSEWMATHAALPFAEHLQGDIFRIYFSPRDRLNRSHVGYLEVDIKAPAKVLNISSEPVLSPGPRGAFDDSGASVACIVPVGNRRFMYYLGWNLGVTVPWRNSIGLAVSEDGGAFKKISLGPIMDRNNVDLFSISYPCVLNEGGKFRMWYGTNLEWGAGEKDMKYVVRYASSDDGVNWTRDGLIAIGFTHPGESAIARAFVLKDGAIYRMWYSWRGESYRIGYAESGDGLNWTRKDSEAGIDVSKDGWDSEMIEYPFVFAHKGAVYMLYNGNGYGKTGFGMAVLEGGWK